MLMPKQFQCYLVQKTGSVFHPAKLASGANYPVGWVQMPHSVRSVGGCTGQGQKTWGGLEGRGSAHAQVCGLHACVAFTSGLEPLPLRFFLSFLLQITPMLFYSRLQAGSRPVQPQPSAGGRRAVFTGSTKGSGRHGRKQNPSVCFLHDA